MFSTTKMAQKQDKETETLTGPPNSLNCQSEHASM